MLIYGQFSVWAGLRQKTEDRRQKKNNLIIVGRIIYKLKLVKAGTGMNKPKGSTIKAQFIILNKIKIYYNII